MNKVFVEYINKDEIGLLSTQAAEPIKAIVTVSAESITPNGKKDTINKDYHLYVGQSVGFDEVDLDQDKIERFKQSGVVQFVKNEAGVSPVYSNDAVYADSQALISGLGCMLGHLVALDYEVPSIEMKSSRK
ncbi:MAG: hypothetical protein IJO33_03255 [Bacilli bacterium]|nr:hypothetical protein [Bacilli bacterium]